MAERMDRRVERTKRSIYQALVALSREEQPERITVTALADRANINRKTFYMYYAGIDDLLDQIETGLLEKYEPFICSVNAVSPEFDVYSFFRSSFGMIQEDMAVWQMLNRYGRLLGLVERAKVLMVEHVLGQLERVGDPQELRLYLEYAAAGVLSMLIEWIRNPVTTLEEFSDFLALITIGGYRAIRDRRNTTDRP